MTYRCFNVEIADTSRISSSSAAGELNTMVPEFWRELPEIVKRHRRRTRRRACIVISSTGKHFSAGMDLAVFTGGNRRAPRRRASTDERGRTRANLRHRRARHPGDVQRAWSARACRC